MELYEDTDDGKKSKLPMILGISTIILTLIMILIIVAIVYLKKSIMQVKLDDQTSSGIESCMYIPDENGDKVYFPIRNIAQYFGYEDYRGDYKIKSEDENKCYVKNDNEIAMFTKDSDKLIKTRGDSDYEYIDLDEKVFEKDGELYTTATGIEKAFNSLIQYDLKQRKVYLYTMEYLNKYYASKWKIDGTTIKRSEDFSDQKAIFEGMMIIIKNDQYGVINAETGDAILENKYEEIRYLPVTSDFLIKSNGKYGILGKNAEVKVRLAYDEINIMDNQNGLYLIKQNNFYGVIDTKGKIILQPEYKQIGLDMSKYTNSGIENQYVLLDKLIPVKNSENLWGIFDIEGNMIRNFELSNIGSGSTSSDYSQVGNLYPVVVVPSYKIVIVEKDKKYNLMTIDGEDLIPSYLLENVYMKVETETGKSEFYMTYNNNEKRLNVEEWLASTGR